MKKAVNIFTALCLFAGVAACGGGSSSDKPSTSGTDGGVVAPSGKKTYRLESVEVYLVGLGDELTLTQRDQYYYNSGNDLRRSTSHTYYTDSPSGRLGLEIDVQYDTIDTWQTSEVIMNIYDSWREEGTGELDFRVAWQDQWDGDVLSFNTEVVTSFDRFTGEVLWEGFHQAFRSYEDGYNTLFEIDYNSDNSTDRTEVREWDNLGRLSVVEVYEGQSTAPSETTEYDYAANGLVEEVTTHALRDGQDYVTAMYFDFSSPTEVVAGRASGTSEDDVVVEVMLLNYSQRDCGAGLAAKAKFETDPIPKCFVK